MVIWYNKLVAADAQQASMQRIAQLQQDFGAMDGMSQEPQTGGGPDPYQTHTYIHTKNLLFRPGQHVHQPLAAGAFVPGLPKASVGDPSLARILRAPTLTLGQSGSTDSLVAQRGESLVMPSPSPVHTPQNNIRPPLSPTLPPVLPDRQLTSCERSREGFGENIVVVFEESTGWKSRLAKACYHLNLDEIYGEGNVGEIFELGVVDGETTFLPEPKPEQFPIYLMKAKVLPGASQASVESTLQDSDGSLAQPANPTPEIPLEKANPEIGISPPAPLSQPAVETPSQKPAIETPSQTTQPTPPAKKPQESIYDDGSYWKTLELEGF